MENLNESISRVVWHMGVSDIYGDSDKPSIY